MARFARVICPGVPYHVTHRGNRRGNVFFRPEDRNAYRSWLRAYAETYGMAVWAYCLMTNHIHLIVAGREGDSLANAIGRTQMRYAQYVNRREGWTGHLWANRFYSTPLDASHLWAAVKYVELNPVRARMVRRAEGYEWSSATAHATGRTDPLLAPDRPFPGPVGDWAAWLAEGLDEEATERIRRNTMTGRPTGSSSFVNRLELLLGRVLTPLKRGRKPKKKYSA